MASLDPGGGYMLDLASPTAIAVATSATKTLRWSLTSRIAFRFSVIYFGLYVLISQMLGGLLVPGSTDFPSLQELPPLKHLVTWTAAHVWGISRPLVITGSGSGDKTFDWIAAFCLLVFAAIATAVWSVLDRRRETYVTAHKWFHVFLRFAAGSTMLVYGMTKAIPMQMPAPGLTRLLEPFGEFSPMGVLWASIGASSAYERCVGSAEIAAAVCLFIPQLSLVGALILLVDSVQIFILNMTYDVPVKLFSFHLILMALVLLAPDARRLLNVLVLNRPALPSPMPPLVRGRRARTIMTAAQIAFGVYLIAMNLVSARNGWFVYGGGVPKPPLYGIWDVETMTVDGAERAPLVTDNERWRRIIIQNANVVVFQLMDNSLVYVPASTDLNARTIMLARSGDQKLKSQLEFDRRDSQSMSLAGDLNGHQIRVTLRLFDRTTMPLLNRC